MAKKDEKTAYQEINKLAEKVKATEERHGKIVTDTTKQLQQHAKMMKEGLKSRQATLQTAMKLGDAGRAHLENTGLQALAEAKQAQAMREQTAHVMGIQTLLTDVLDTKVETARVADEISLMGKKELPYQEQLNSVMRERATLAAGMEGQAEELVKLQNIQTVGGVNLAEIEDKISHYKSIGHDELAKTLEAAAKLHEEQIKSLETQILESGEREEALEFAEIQLKQEQASRKTLERKKELLEGFASIFGKTLGDAKKFGQTLRGMVNPLTVTIGIVAGLGKLFFGLVSSALKMQKETGVGAGHAMDLNIATRDAAVGGFMYGESLADVQARATALVTEWGVVNETTKRSVEVATDLERNYGIAAGSAAKLAELMSATSSSTKDVLLQDMGEEMKALQEEGIPVGTVMEEVAGNADFFASHMKDSGTNIIKAAMFAKKLGMNMNTITGAADSLLDFESSVNAEMEASMLLGRRINTDKARQLAFAGDMEGMQKEIMRQVGSEAQFNRMNVFQRKALAKAFGLSVSDLATMVAGQEKLNNMTTEQQEDHAKNQRVTANIQKIWGGITGILKKLYASIIVPISKKFMEILGIGGDIGNEMGDTEGILESIENWIGPITDKFTAWIEDIDVEKLEVKFASIRTGIKEMARSIKDVAGGIFGWVKDLGTAEDGTFSMTKLIESLKIKVEDLGKKLKVKIKLEIKEIKEEVGLWWKELGKARFVIMGIAGAWALNKLGLMSFVTDGIKELGKLIWKLGKAAFAKKALDAPSPTAGKKGGMLSGFGKMKPASMLKGAAAMVILAAAVWVMAKALQQFSKGVNWKGFTMGLVSLGALTVAALLLGGVSPVVLVGAAAMVVLAGAVWVLGKAMQEFGKASQLFIPFFESMAQTGREGGLGTAALGIVAIGAALAGFGIGGAIGGIGSAIGEFFGGDPVEKFKRFAEIAPELETAGRAIENLSTSLDTIMGKGGGLSLAAEGISAIGGALAKFGGGSALSGIGSAIGDFFSGDPIEKFERFAAMAVPLTMTAAALDTLTGAMERYVRLPIAEMVEPTLELAEAMEDFKKLEDVALNVQVAGMPEFNTTALEGKLDEISTNLDEIDKKLDTTGPIAQANRLTSDELRQLGK